MVQLKKRNWLSLHEMRDRVFIRGCLKYQNEAAAGWNGEEESARKSGRYSECIFWSWLAFPKSNSLEDFLAFTSWLSDWMNPVCKFIFVSEWLPICWRVVHAILSVISFWEVYQPMILRWDYWSLNWKGNHEFHSCRILAIITVDWFDIDFTGMNRGMSYQGNAEELKTSYTSVSNLFCWISIPKK